MNWVEPASNCEVVLPILPKIKSKNLAQELQKARYPRDYQVPYFPEESESEFRVGKKFTL